MCHREEVALAGNFSFDDDALGSRLPSGEDERRDSRTAPTNSSEGFGLRAGSGADFVSLTYATMGTSQTPKPRRLVRRQRELKVVHGKSGVKREIECRNARRDRKNAFLLSENHLRKRVR